MDTITPVKLLTENDVCEAVCAWLKRRGFKAEWIPAGRRGFDIQATHSENGQRWIIEAKGATSSNQSSKAYGRDYGQSGAYHGVSQAFWMATRWACLPEMNGINLGIAIPSTRHFDNHSVPIERACRLLGIAIFRVDSHGNVTAFPAHLENGCSKLLSRPEALLQ